ncbi:MAG: hypothetical protein RBU27_09575 [Bacteroidota bacterium]|jgi:hypothetical protein|nr:hypothetical protein [Bacteroidota bacterium]
MHPESQAALAALEQELEHLRSAVDHIDQTRSIAQNVVESVGVIQRKYAEHLDALLAVQKEAVREAGTLRQEQFDELSASARRHILESAARAKKYLEEYNAEMKQGLLASGDMATAMLRDVAEQAGGVIASTGEQLHGQLDALLSDVRHQLERMHEQAGEQIVAGSSNAARHIDEIAGRAAGAVQGLDARARGHLDELGALAKGSVQDVLARAKEMIEEAGNQSKRIYAAIKKTQDQQTTEFEKVTVSADALIASSGKLVRSIDAIDFPARMQSIESDIHSLHYNFNSAMSRIDALGKSNEQAMQLLGEDVVGKLGRMEMFTEKAVRTHGDEMEKRFREQDSQVRNLRILLVVVLLFNLLIAAGVLLLWNRAPEAPPPVTPAAQVAPDTLAAQPETIPEKDAPPTGRRRTR